MEGKRGCEGGGERLGGRGREVGREGERRLEGGGETMKGRGGENQSSVERKDGREKRVERWEGGREGGDKVRRRENMGWRRERRLEKKC